MARELLKADDETEASLLDRRSYLKLAGAAAAAVTASTGGATAASSTVGFGEGQYGVVPYGGVEPTGSAPTVDRFALSKSEQLGTERMLSVEWSVADADGDLDVVEIVVSDGSTNVDFSVQNVNGASASGWELFQFPMGTGLNVTVRVKDAAGNVEKSTKTVTL